MEPELWELPFHISWIREAHPHLPPDTHVHILTSSLPVRLGQIPKTQMVSSTVVRNWCPPFRILYKKRRVCNRDTDLRPRQDTD